MVVLGLTMAGDTWGLGKTWAKTELVHRFPILR
jgi:thiosulfate dehydrogenase [quinone] large subunit